MARKVPPQKPPEPSASAPSAASRAKPEMQALELPKGAMIAFRENSPSRVIEFYLYPDGRISFNVPDSSKEAYEHPSRKLNDAQINHLRHLLDQVNYYRAASAQVKTSGDGVAYEISARVGNKANAIELHEGAVPENIKPLVEELKSFLPKA